MQNLARHEPGNTSRVVYMVLAHTGLGNNKCQVGYRKRVDFKQLKKMSKLNALNSMVLWMIVY